MPTVSEIRKQIVDALMAGEDTAALEKQLRVARLAEMGRAEVDSLKAVAGRRADLKAQAASLTARVKVQGEAIDQFLKARDGLAKGIQKIILQAKSLEPLQASCFSEFSNGQAFRDATGKLPANYWNGATCPMLAHDKCEGPEIVQWLQHYLGLALESLSKARRLEIQPVKGAVEAEVES
jgi:hypothetical protein